MTPRGLTTSLLACLVAGSALLGPPAALGSAGGAAAPDGGSGSPLAPTTTTQAPAAGGASPAAFAPNTLQPPAAGVLVRHRATLRGELTSSAAHRTVLVQLLDPSRGWSTVAQTVADGRGEFSATWRAKHVGRFQVRALEAGTASASSVDAPSTLLEVYKPVRATWFGPSLYGGRTACGETMTAQLQGVAHRTLPCGTLVDITYGGRTVTVPVVDRGPYVHGVTLDLTTATAGTLGFSGSGPVGALALR